MMTFEEWIATQDETQFDLDEASVESIKDWFRYREICDDTKMDTFFWRQLRMYRYKYKQMLRMETVDFDPLVNRYFEAEYTTNQSTTGSNTGSSSVESETTSDTTTSNTTNFGATVTNSGNDATVHNTTVAVTEQGTTTETDGRTTTDTVTHNTTDNTTDNGTNTQTDGRTITDRSTTQYGSTDTETKNLTTNVDKESFIRRSETTNDNGSKTTSDSGTSSSLENTLNDSNATKQHAEKIAPMSAVNVTSNSNYTGMTQTGEMADTMAMGDSASVSKRIPRTGHMDFTYATGYSQDDSYAHATNQDYTSSSHSNNGSIIDNNSSTKTYTYSGSGDTEDIDTTETGTDTHAKTGTDTTTNTRTVTGDLEDEHSNTVVVTKTGTDTTKRTVTGTLQDAISKTSSTGTTGTDTLQHGHVVTNGGSDTSSGTNSNTSTGEVTTTNTSSNNSLTTGTNRNRYTGREGLTPQEGLSKAMDYLMGYSPAFKWLVYKLEPCFIGILDVEDDFEDFFDWIR